MISNENKGEQNISLDDFPLAQETNGKFFLFFR
jgi:hypothetical protein